MTMRLASLIFVLGVFAASASPADAQAPTGKTMLEIVTALEALGYGPITEVSLKRGRWEVEAYKGDTPYELHVDGTTGRTVVQRPDDGDSKPPANAKKLSEILQALAAQGYTQIVEASFETR